MRLAATAAAVEHKVRQFSTPFLNVGGFDTCACMRLYAPPRNMRGKKKKIENL